MRDDDLKKIYEKHDYVEQEYLKTKSILENLEKCSEEIKTSKIQCKLKLKEFYN